MLRVSALGGINGSAPLAPLAPPDPLAPLDPLDPLAPLDPPLQLLEDTLLLFHGLITLEPSECSSSRSWCFGDFLF